MSPRKRLDVQWDEKLIIPMNNFEYEILFQSLATNPRMREYLDFMAMLKSVYYLIQRNYYDLLDYYDSINTSQNQIALLNNEKQGQIIYTNISSECTRFLHNLLASFVAHIDINRNIFIRTDIFSEEFQRLYQNEIDSRFKDNIQALFIKQLRQFILHRKLVYGMPKVIFTQTSDNTMVSSIQIFLPRSNLLEWDGWNAKEREYIELSLSEEIDIFSILQIHFTNITNFYEWISRAVSQDFKNDIDNLNSQLLKIKTL